MSVIHDLILDGGIVFTGTIGDAELETLFEAASERCLTEAESRTVYLSDALDALDRYREFEPGPEEVCDHLGRHEVCGDWRKVVTAAAFCTVREFLGQQVERDVDALRVALGEATERGYEAVALHAACPWGWAPHIRETGWTNGVLFEWPRESSDTHVSALAVPVSGHDHLWLRLARR